MVYFITDGEYTKIGRGKHIRPIINRINTSNPRKISLVALVEGHLDVQKKLHKEFQRQKVHGEWYEISIKQIFEVLHKFNLTLVHETTKT